MSRVERTSRSGATALLWLGAMGLATYALSALSLASPLEEQGTALFWLGSGLSLGVLTMVPLRAWPSVLGAVLLACLISNAQHHIPWQLNLTFAFANVAEPALAAWLFRRWLAGGERSLVAQAVQLALAAALGALIGALIGTGALLWAGRVASFQASFSLWFIDDLLGALVVAPFLVAWWPKSDWHVGPMLQRFWLELLGFAAIMLLSGAVTFWRNDSGNLALVALYVHLAVLLFGAVRLGPRGATLGSLGLSLCAVLGTVHQHGPFANATWSIIERATALQGYLAVTALVGLIPAMLIAERTRASEALRSREREVEEIFQSLGDAVLVTDETRRIRYTNSAAVALAGFERGSMLGRLITDVVALEDSEEDVDVARLAIEKAEVVRSTKPRRLLRADGRERWIALTGAPLENEAGRVRGAVLVLSDETERRAHAAKLQEAERQLVHSQKLQAVGELAAGVAHDFNNILTVIAASGELLRLDAPDAVQPLVEDVMAASAKAARLTAQLLVFNRKDSFELSPVDVNEVTLGLSNMLHRLLGEDIALETQLGEKPQMVLADRGQLEQVILNLAVNARDAMPVGGKLNIRVTSAVPDAVDGGKPYVSLEVQDTGHGMDRATLERIFEPFFTTKPVGVGTGLGLATVHTICTRHGGLVRATSTLGKGSCFSVLLPQIERAALQACKPEESTASGKGEHILLVEDSAELRVLVQKLLQRAGFHVTAAHDTLAALELLRARRFELLLSDVVMPDMNGRELAERAQKLAPKLRILFMSGYSAGVLEQRVSGLEGYGLLRKPFSAAALTSAVLAALAEPQRAGGAMASAPPPGA